MPARRRHTGSESEPLIAVEKTHWAYSTSNFEYSNLSNNASENYLEDNFADYYIEPELIMTARDRTNEFVTTLRSLQGKNIARALATGNPRKARAVQNHSEFMLIARNVGKNIASTYTKLEKLTLCKY